MQTVTLEEAQARLPELIEGLTGRECIVITKNRTPSARITRIETNSEPLTNRVPGSAIGQLVIIPDDRKPGICSHMWISYVEDDEHLKDFAEYM